ncbi:MAG: exosortase A [Pseudomonadota bacterium]
MTDQADYQTSISTSAGSLRQWHQGVLTYFGVAVLMCAVMHEAVISIYRIATSSNTFGHILLIPFVIAWLIYNRVPELKQLRPSPIPLAAPLLLGPGFLWLLGQVADVQLAQQLALVASLQILVLVVFGRLGLAALAFPTFFMIFLVPFGEEFVPQLQDITARFVVKGLSLLDIPVYTDGVFLQTPSGDFEVAEACSGIRFMVSTFALGTLFSVLCFKSWVRRSIVIVLSLLIPIVANGIRAFGIVYIAYLTDNTVAVGVDHIIYGWIFFAFVTIVLILVGLTFSDRSVQDPPIDVAKLKGLEKPVAGLRLWLPYAKGGALAIGSVALFFLAMMAINARQPEQRTLAFPVLEVDGWSELETYRGDAWLPVYKGADTSDLIHFTNGENVVSVYRAGYSYQRQGAELIGYGNSVLPDSELWGRARTKRKTVRLAGQDQYVEYNMLRTNFATLRDVWQVYLVNDKLVSSPVRVKIETVLAKLTGGPLYTATFAISAPRQNAADTARGEAVLEAFGAVLPPIKALMLPTSSREDDKGR